MVSSTTIRKFLEDDVYPGYAKHAKHAKHRSLDMVSFVEKYIPKEQEITEAEFWKYFDDLAKQLGVDEPESLGCRCCRDPKVMTVVI